MKNKEHYCLCVFYEDIITRPKEEVSRIFNAIGMNLNDVEHSLEALKTDSQKGQFGQRGSESVNVTETEFERVDRWYKHFGVPANSNQTLEEMKKIFDI